LQHCQKSLRDESHGIVLRRLEGICGLLQDMIIQAAGQDWGPKGLHLVPPTHRENLDTIVKWTSAARAVYLGPPHRFSLREAKNVLCMLLSVLHWFYCEYEYGPHLDSIYSPEAESEISIFLPGPFSETLDYPFRLEFLRCAPSGGVRGFRWYA